MEPLIEIISGSILQLKDTLLSNLIFYIIINQV